MSHFTFVSLARCSLTYVTKNVSRIVTSPAPNYLKTDRNYALIIELALCNELGCFLLLIASQQLCLHYNNLRVAFFLYFKSYNKIDNQTIKSELKYQIALKSLKMKVVFLAYFHWICRSYDVIVGHNVAIGGDDESGAWERMYTLVLNRSLRCFFWLLLCSYCKTCGRMISALLMGSISG